jgi:hypothetical protein
MKFWMFWLEVCARRPNKSRRSKPVLRPLIPRQVRRALDLAQQHVKLRVVTHA